MSRILWESKVNGVEYQLIDYDRHHKEIVQGTEDVSICDNILFITVTKEAPEKIDQIFLHCTENNIPIDKVIIEEEKGRSKKFHIGSLFSCPHVKFSEINSLYESYFEKEIHIYGVDQIDLISMNLGDKCTKGLRVSLFNSGNPIRIGDAEGHFTLEIGEEGSDGRGIRKKENLVTCNKLSVNDLFINRPTQCEGDIDCKGCFWSKANVEIAGDLSCYNFSICDQGLQLSAKNSKVDDKIQLSSKNLKVDKRITIYKGAKVNIEENIVFSQIIKVQNSSQLIAGGHISSKNISNDEDLHRKKENGFKKNILGEIIGSIKIETGAGLIAKDIAVNQVTVNGEAKISNSLKTKQLKNHGITSAKRIEADLVSNNGTLLSFENINVESFISEKGIIDCEDTKNSKITAQKKISINESNNVKVCCLVSKDKLEIKQSFLNIPIEKIEAENLILKRSMLSCNSLKTEKLTANLSSLDVKSQLVIGENLKLDSSKLLADRVNEFILNGVGELLNCSRLLASSSNITPILSKLGFDNSSEVSIFE